MKQHKKIWFSSAWIKNRKSLFCFKQTRDLFLHYGRQKFVIQDQFTEINSKEIQKNKNSNNIDNNNNDDDDDDNFDLNGNDEGEKDPNKSIWIQLVEKVKNNIQEKYQKIHNIENHIQISKRRSRGRGKRGSRGSS